MALFARIFCGICLVMAIWIYPNKIGAGIANTVKAGVEVVVTAGEKIHIPGEDAGANTATRTTTR